MVLTMTMRGTVIARHVRSQLDIAAYPLLRAEMPHRVAYPEAAIEGLSPAITDPDGAAARDIAAIVHELMNLGSHEFVKPSAYSGQEVASAQKTGPPALVMNE